MKLKKEIEKIDLEKIKLEAETAKLQMEERLIEKSVEKVQLEYNMLANCSSVGRSSIYSSMSQYYNA